MQLCHRLHQHSQSLSAITVTRHFVPSPMAMSISHHHKQHWHLQHPQQHPTREILTPNYQNHPRSFRMSINQHCLQHMIFQLWTKTKIMMWYGHHSNLDILDYHLERTIAGLTTLTQHQIFVQNDCKNKKPLQRRR